MSSFSRIASARLTSIVVMDVKVDVCDVGTVGLMDRLSPYDAVSSVVPNSSEQDFFSQLF